MSNLREIRIYAFQGNYWSGFESENISYGSSTRGYCIPFIKKNKFVTLTNT